ncbi:MAG: hypothetical protein GX871_02340 [Microbacteriaceae bacterium]|jgi:hypothetical protein|nr:hypothetical protein [Microbacteriaceae bacterium]HOA86523.1 hypothetical protein [Microbacteriaceae bacterium]HPZ35073.1 hypothetical protein [Microbacteriaceae bacterium]HQC92478.1 hypothetical protein [Microbacteriaceae bacterium]
MAAQQVLFDSTPLTGPVDRARVRAWQRSQPRASSAVSASTVVVLVVVAVVFVWVFVGIGQIAVRAFTNGDAAIAWPVTLLLMLGGGALVVLVPVWYRRARSARAYRLDQFSRANHLRYVPGLGAPALPGMIFTLGHSRQASDLVRGDQPRFVEFANYRYTTGSGKNQSTHTWGYVAIKLDVPLPHIVLDAKGNNSLFGTNLPVSLDREQRLRLEGDFDRFFSLYCPEGYETDALYLFTPDIMARFVDHAAALDVEIVDDWLFLYARRDLVTLDPAAWAWLFGTVQALLDKLGQWARWRDERLRLDASATPLGIGAPIPGLAAAAGAAASTVPFAGAAPLTPPPAPPPGVAPGGRRLRRAVSWPAIITIGVFVLFWVLSQSGVLSAIFGAARG